MAAVKYQNTGFRVIVAVIASIYVLLHGHDLSSIKHAFVSPSFYLAIIVSFPITLSLVYMIHRVTVKLDTLHDWRSKFVERFIWQLLFAVVLPSLIDLALISIYSAIVAGSFDQTEFLLYDFPIIVSFIALLNMYYILRYFMLTDRALNEKYESGQNGSILTIDYGGVHAQLNVCLDILFLYRENNLVKVVTRNHTYSMRESIGSLESKLLDDGFIRIGRGTIVNLKFIQGFGPGDKRGTQKVLFSVEVNESNYDPDTFNVTEKYLASFKSAFGRRI